MTVKGYLNFMGSGNMNLIIYDLGRDGYLYDGKLNLFDELEVGRHEEDFKNLLMEEMISYDYNSVKNRIYIVVDAGLRWCVDG